MRQHHAARVAPPRLRPASPDTLRLSYALAGYDAGTYTGRMHAIDIARAARELTRRYDERAAAAIAEIDARIDGRVEQRNP